MELLSRNLSPGEQVDFRHYCEEIDLLVKSPIKLALEHLVSQSQGDKIMSGANCALNTLTGTIELWESIDEKFSKAFHKASKEALDGS